MATGKYGGEGTNPFKTQFSSFHCGSQGSNSGHRGCATSTSIRGALSQAPGFELLIVSPHLSLAGSWDQSYSSDQDQDQVQL